MYDKRVFCEKVVWVRKFKGVLECVLIFFYGKIK